MFQHNARIDPIKRIAATAIDFLLAALIYQVLAWITWDFLAFLIAWTLILLKDAPLIPALGGVSPGKKALGLRVIAVKGHNLDLLTSFKRNLPLAAGVAVYLATKIIFVLVPLFGEIVAWFLGTLVSILAMITEITKMYQDPEGERIGDLLAGTLVVENP